MEIDRFGLAARRALLCACLGLGVFPASGAAGTITVTTTGDTVSGGDGLCSLREAVYAANLNGGAATTGCSTGDAASLDSIRLASGSTYQLTNNVPAGQELSVIYGDLEVAAAGPVRVQTASGDAPATVDATDRDRAFQVLDTADLTLTNLRVVNGSAPAGEAGGGLRAENGDLSLYEVEVSGNVATASGGGISVGAGGSLEIRDSVISGNGIAATAANTSALGGGIHNEGNAEIVRTDITENDISAQDGFTIGGGVYNSASGTAIVRASTLRGHDLAGNVNGQFGGGIGNDGELSVVNSTIAANQVGSSDLTGHGGAGIYSTASGNAEIRQSTIAGNGMFVPGGGDALRGENFEVSGSILSLGSSDVVCLVSDQITSGDNNVVFQDTCDLNAPNDLHLTEIPAVGGLADNGGPTPTSAIAPGSEMVDHVPTEDCLDLNGASLGSDQRGASRPFGSACDAGAYELTKCSGAVIDSDPELGAGCPVPVTLDFTPAATNSLPPFISLPSPARKLCKKGQKLKKGKCVKKRRKVSRAR